MLELFFKMSFTPKKIKNAPRDKATKSENVGEISPTVRNLPAKPLIIASKE